MSIVDLLIQVSGITNVSGEWYGFWSGVGSIFVPPALTVFGFAVIQWWHHTCHVNGCYRIGRHPIDGTPYVVCKKHHPEIKGD